MESKKKLTVQYKEIRFESFQEKDGTYRCLVSADMIPQSQKNDISLNEVVSDLNNFCPMVPIAILNFFVKIAIQYEVVLMITTTNSIFIQLNEAIFIQYSAAAFGCTIGCENRYEKFITQIANDEHSHSHSVNAFGAALFYDVELMVAEKIIEEVMSTMKE